MVSLTDPGALCAASQLARELPGDFPVSASHISMEVGAAIADVSRQHFRIFVDSRFQTQVIWIVCMAGTCILELSHQPTLYFS